MRKKITKAKVISQKMPIGIVRRVRVKNDEKRFLFHMKSYFRSQDT